ncbi:MAG TPA: dTDP-4-amino-4,6-dideoxygalactose transaminase [Candidatus Nanoarchaeia archaeon]|nr:dTDP-4-amino-4,6-dideoxygalactose transaminase [Candidatus Nanoarchaeia archaeon]
MILFNQPHITGKEIEYIREAIAAKHLSGNNFFTKKCQEWLEKKFGFQKILLTPSCTDALEMAAILIDIQPEDEVIMPSYTFTSTANAFILRGAKIIFADSETETPNIDADQIEKLITEKTKAIVPVHYAGVACDMDKIMALADKYRLAVAEDAAQAIDAFYKGRPLGSIGHFGAFSFHETKNITCGEGGALAINDQKFNRRAEIVWEKGTNRAEFFRGEVNKYGWTDIGSSFLPSDITAAFLYAQLGALAEIQAKRIGLWRRYYGNLQGLAEKKMIKLPVVPNYATNNAHTFYFTCADNSERDKLIAFLKDNGITASFHYLPLHQSAFFKNKRSGAGLERCERFSDTLVRLPLFCDLKPEEADFICEKIKTFFNFKQYG